MVRKAEISLCNALSAVVSYVLPAVHFHIARRATVAVSRAIHLSSQLLMTCSKSRKSLMMAEQHSTNLKIILPSMKFCGLLLVLRAFRLRVILMATGTKF